MTSKKNVISHFGGGGGNSGSYNYNYTNRSIILPKISDPSAIENRLPNIVFTGPNGSRDQQVKVISDKFEIGIGRFSNLRTFSAEYLTRGQSGDIIKQRRNYPGEIGWNYEYFRNLYPVSHSNRRHFSGFYNPR